MEQDQGRLFQYANVLLSQELPDAQEVVSRCMAMYICPRSLLYIKSNILIMLTVRD